MARTFGTGLRDLQDVSPAMSGVNLTRSITQGMQAPRAVKDNSLCKLWLTRCAHLSASATCDSKAWPIAEWIRELQSPWALEPKWLQQQEYKYNSQCDCSLFGEWLW